MVKTAAEPRNQSASLKKAVPQLMQEDTLRQRLVEALDRFLKAEGITTLAILLKLLVVRVATQKRLTPYGSVVELFRQSSPMYAMKDLEHYVPRISSVFEEDVFL